MEPTSPLIQKQALRQLLRTFLKVVLAGLCFGALIFLLGKPAARVEQATLVFGVVLAVGSVLVAFAIAGVFRARGHKWLPVLTVIVGALLPALGYTFGRIPGILLAALVPPLALLFFVKRDKG